MSKSVYVIGGLGVVGCLALSFMMQHLLKVKSDSARSPVALEIEETCATYLDGPVEVTTLDIDGERTMLVRMRVQPGVEREKLARSVGDLVWKRAHKWRELPDRLRFEVRCTGESLPAVVDSRPSGLRGLRTGRAATPSPAAPTPAPAPAGPPK